MAFEWITCLDKRPSDRSREDLDLIYMRLQNIKAFDKFHPSLLQQICYFGYYEDLESGVTLFRQGDIGTNWYTVLSGSLKVLVSESSSEQDAVMICTLGVGMSFGEAILQEVPHQATVVTKEFTELIRIELRDFKVLWERNKPLLEKICTSFNNIAIQGHCQFANQLGFQNFVVNGGGESSEESSAAITIVPSPRLCRAGHVLRTVLLSKTPHMIRDRKYHLRTYRRCWVGSELVDWLLQQGPLVHSRNQAIGMVQALLEEGVISHVCHQHQFKDRYLFYRFHVDEQGPGPVPSVQEEKKCDDVLQDVLLTLAQIGPDAMMRMILRKPPSDRTVEDLEIIYEELLHIKALSHLSTMVKRELASVLVFESHSKAGTVLFNQGDEGKSWYIILKGSVNVVIYGKGVVCTLNEGDDFGKLALINDAPRAATIVLREDNCHFLRVDKDDFNRILRDVEANTVRLKEHGKDVLVLEKIPANSASADGNTQTTYRYSVMAGTPEKMLEHLLETSFDNKNSESPDPFLDVFLLTHVIFMPCDKLCAALLSHYHAKVCQNPEDDSADYAITQKKCVINFVNEWSSIAPDSFREDPTIKDFILDLYESIKLDSITFASLKDEATCIEDIIKSEKGNQTVDRVTSRRKISPNVIMTRRLSKENVIEVITRRRPINPTDENIIKVFCADHTYITLKLPMESTVKELLFHAQDKLGLGSDLVLCEVKSNGEREVMREDDLGITTSLSVNGQLFVSPREHIDALTPLQKQEGPTTGTANSIELLSSKELAYHMALRDWELFICVDEYELIYKVFGRHNFGKITANLDLLLRRFNEIQYWVATEMVLAQNVSKRVQLLRKFIKLAAHCKEYQNLNSFFAIVMGLSNIAISRLSQTWLKLPGKFKKMFSDFETLMDPSRNHRVYRLFVSKLQPPIIPFMPLLMKDLTFTHEGNKTYFDGLVNFEKMHMIAQTMKTVKHCRSCQLNLETPSSLKSSSEVVEYFRNMQVIDNQRVLTQLSYKLEPRRT